MRYPYHSIRRSSEPHVVLRLPYRCSIYYDPLSAGIKDHPSTRSSIISRELGHSDLSSIYLSVKSKKRPLQSRVSGQPDRSFWAKTTLQIRTAISHADSTELPFCLSRLDSAPSEKSSRTKNRVFKPLQIEIRRRIFRSINRQLLAK